MDKVEIFGVGIDNIDFNEAKAILASYLNQDELKTIFTPNPEIVMAAKENPLYKDLLNQADLVTADGIGLIYGSRIRKKPLKERVTGFDLSIEMLELANKEKKTLYLLGAKPGYAQKAGENITRDYENIRVLGARDGYFKGAHNGNPGSNEEKEIINDIYEKNPDIIFVGLGFPGQETWINENKDKIRGRIIIGNGGVIDILSGQAKRAPEIYQKLGLEWFYRLVKNPSRIKRQIAIPKFMFHIIFGKDPVK